MRVGRFNYFVQPPPREEAVLRETPEARVVAEWPLGHDRPGVFHIRWYDRSGSPVRTRAYRLRPVPYTDARLDEIAEGSIRGGRDYVMPWPEGASLEPSPAEAARGKAAVRAAMEYPPHEPPVLRWTASEDGALWLQRRAGSDDGPMARWLVLEPEGEVRGRIDLPRRGFDILRLHGDEVWASVADDFDVPWLVRYRLASEGR